MFSETELANLRKLTDDTVSIYDILTEKEINAVDESTSRRENMKSHVLIPPTNRRETLIILKKLILNLNIKRWLREISNVINYTDTLMVWVSFSFSLL